MDFILKKKQLQVLFAVTFTFVTTTVSATTLDYTEYASVLKAHVDSHGMVDYTGLKGKRATLQRVVTNFGQVTRDEYDNWSRNEKISFLINAYNTFTLALIVRNYPVDSIKKLNKPWDKREWKLLGNKVSLNQIEHHFLRKHFDEPRIHFALVCAARGCPPLKNRVWTAQKLGSQLRSPTVKFLKDSKKFKIDKQRSVVFISPLFDWYGEDFIGKYAPETGFGDHSKKIKAVLCFFSKHIPKADAKFLKAGSYSVELLSYDWSLNDQRGR